MSTERRSSPGRGRGQGRSQGRSEDGRGARRFARLSIAMLGGFGLLAVGLAAANGTQGPRLAHAEANRTMLVERQDQRLVLHANQPVGEASEEQVSVEPDASFEVVSDGAAVTLRFEEPLRYGADYSVSVEVQGAYTGSEGTLRTTLRTPDPGVHTLIRSAEAGEDRVVRRSLTSPGGDETVFAADRIQEYAVVGDVIAAVTLDETGRPALGVSPLARSDDAVALAEATAATTQLTPDGVDRVSQLRVEPVAQLIGYVVDGGGSLGREHRGALLVDDPSTGMTAPTEIRDSEGRPLPVADWRFVRGTTELVLETRDGAFFAADALMGGVAEPLAADDPRRDVLEATPAVRVNADRTAVTMTREETGVSDGEAAEEGRGVESERELFRPAADSSRIGSLCLSPNGEYAAIEVVPVEGRPDGYAGRPGFTSTETSFVRLEDGETVRRASGMLSNWCTG